MILQAPFSFCLGASFISTGSQTTGAPLHRNSRRRDASIFSTSTALPGSTAAASVGVRSPRSFSSAPSARCSSSSVRRAEGDAKRFHGRGPVSQAGLKMANGEARCGGSRWLWNDGKMRTYFGSAGQTRLQREPGPGPS